MFYFKNKNVLKNIWDNDKNLVFLNRENNTIKGGVNDNPATSNKVLLFVCI